MTEQVQRPDLYKKYLPKMYSGDGYVEILGKGSGEIWINLKAESEELSLLISDYIVRQIGSHIQNEYLPLYELISNRLVKLDDQVEKINIQLKKVQSIIDTNLANITSNTISAADAINYYKLSVNLDKTLADCLAEQITLKALSTKLKYSVNEIVYTPIQTRPSIKKTAAFGSVLLMMSILVCLVLLGGVRIHRIKND